MGHRDRKNPVQSKGDNPLAAGFTASLIPESIREHISDILSKLTRIRVVACVCHYITPSTPLDLFAPSAETISQNLISKGVEKELTYADCS
jgi:hypothetical protein